MTLGAWYFLFVIGVLYPLSALKSSRARVERGTAFPRMLVYRRTFINQIILGVFALWIARDAHLDLFAPWSPTVAALLIGAASLGIRLAVLALPARYALTSEHGRSRARELAPQTSAERWMFLGLVAVVAVSEEIVYRGLMFRLLSIVAGGAWWPAALITALAFSLVHVFQGPRSSAIVFAYGMLGQLVVRLTGTLYVVIAVHFVYDTYVGIVRARQPRAIDDLPATDTAVA